MSFNGNTKLKFSNLKSRGAVLELEAANIEFSHGPDSELEIQFKKELSSYEAASEGFEKKASEIVDLFAAGDSIFARGDHGPIGAIIYRQIDEKIKEIDYLATLPQCRGRGVMKSLLNWFQGQLSLGEEIWLEVSALNHRAIALYKGLGFKEVSRRPAYYPDKSDAILYTYINNLP